MKFTTTTLLISGMAAMVSAKAAFTNVLFDIEAGEPFNLTWKDDSGSGPFMIGLMNGPTDNLQLMMLLGSTNDNILVWTPPPTLPTDQYVFAIADSTEEPNYSLQWAFQGLNNTTTTSTTSALSSVTTVPWDIIFRSMRRKPSRLTVAPVTRTRGRGDFEPSTFTMAPSSASTGAMPSAATRSNGQQIEKPLAFLWVAAAGFVLLN